MYSKQQFQLHQPTWMCDFSAVFENAPICCDLLTLTYKSSTYLTYSLPCNSGHVRLISLQLYLVLLPPFLANVNSCSRSLYVCLSVYRLCATFVNPTQPMEIFGNVSALFNTLVT